MATLVGTKLSVDGYMYIRSRKQRERIYWDCQKLRGKECTARAITNDPAPGEAFILIKGPAESPHAHPPNVEQCRAETVVQKLKRKAADHPEQPPAMMLRTELAAVPMEVLSQLPQREALSKMVRRTRRQNLPPNPKSLNELHMLPDQYQRTLQGQRFLMYDSREEYEDEDEELHADEQDEEAARVLVFATRRNIELLCESSTWFLDGTFKVSPTIFTQVFTILGVRKRSATNGEEVPLPFVYAFLTGKTTDQYAAVLRAVRDAVEEFRINECTPERIMTDFELGIINACRDIFPDAPVNCCMFHLGQAVYRRVQAEGLQAAYNNPEDRNLKTFTHMMLAVAYVPLEDVLRVFNLLRDRCPEDFLPVLEYFARTYVHGIPARGRRRAVLPRYPPSLWNQYTAAVNNTHKTNNASEGWHNRFRIVVGKHHPDLYAALTELQKEQADTEVAVAELSLGKKVKSSPKHKWLELHTRIGGIVTRYNVDYKEKNDDLLYLRTLAHTIVL